MAKRKSTIEGSHKLGRIEHEMIHGQTAVADVDRIEKIKERLPMKFCEMHPGNTYHRVCN
jgi:hypothetical protein